MTFEQWVINYEWASYMTHGISHNPTTSQSGWACNGTWAGISRHTHGPQDSTTAGDFCHLEESSKSLVWSHLNHCILNLWSHSQAVQQAVQSEKSLLAVVAWLSMMFSWHEALSRQIITDMRSSNLTALLFFIFLKKHYFGLQIWNKCPKFKISFFW